MYGLRVFIGICKLGHACLKTSEQCRLVASVDDDQISALDSLHTGQVQPPKS